MKTLLKLLTILTLSFLFTACGGGGGTTEATPIDKIKSIIIGDSNTHITAAELNSIEGVSGATEDKDYTAALQAGTYADPANPTAEEIQAVIDAVNAYSGSAGNTIPVCSGSNNGLDQAQDTTGQTLTGQTADTKIRIWHSADGKKKACVSSGSVTME